MITRRPKCRMGEPVVNSHLRLRGPPRSVEDRSSADTPYQQSVLSVRKYIYLAPEEHNVYSLASAYKHLAPPLVGLGQYHLAVAGGCVAFWPAVMWSIPHGCAPTRYRGW